MTVGLLSTFFRGYAQNYVVKDICELPSDLIARTEVRMDKNGHECAVVRVNIPSVKRMEFGEDAVVGKTLPGEYVLYVPENTQKLSYSIDENSKGIIDFSAFQIGLKGKCTYRCTLQRSDKLAAGKKGTLKLHTNPEGAIALLNGEPIGETPLTLSDVTIGEHKLGFAYTDPWSTRPDTIISITEGQILSLSLQLKEEEYPEPATLLDWGEGGATTVPYKEIENNGKKGIVHLTGKILVPCEYDIIVKNNDRYDYFVVGVNIGEYYQYGLYKAGEKLVLPVAYDWIVLLPNNLAWTKKNGKWGYSHIVTGKDLTPHMYDGNIHQPKNGFCIVDIDRNHQQYLKIEGNELKEMPYTFDMACDFNKEGFAIANLPREQGGNCVILDAKNFSEGKCISTPYRIIKGWTYFSDGLCPVRANGKYGAIDTKGQLVVPAIYDEMSNFLSGSAYVELNGKNCYISQKGNVIEGSGDWEKDTYGDKKYLIITKNGKQGIVHRSGKIVVPCEYDECEVLGSEHTRGELGFNKSKYFSAIKDDVCYVYGEQGLVFTCPDNCKANYYEDGFFTIVDQETYTKGYANAQGELVAGPIYEDAPSVYWGQYQISEGLLIVWIGHRCGFLNSRGEMVVPMDYTGAFPFVNGKTYVQKQNGKWIELDRKTISSRQQ